jgi:hypothetical protein
MTYPQTEQRAARRFALTLPISVECDEMEIQTETRDISARGVSFYMDPPLQPGTSISLLLTLPSEITRTDAIRVRCFGHIVRLDERFRIGQRVVVAAALERYEFLPSVSV